MKKIPYTGAGLLIAHANPENGWEILLFQRAIRPHQDYWSIVGGEKEKHEDFRTAAFREASEEACGGARVEAFFRPYLRPGYDRQHARQEKTYWIPLAYEWRTYLLELERRIPPTELRLNWENRAARWFPVDRLPSLTHPGVHRSLRRFALPKAKPVATAAGLGSSNLH